MIITTEILEQGKSKNGGWSRAQLRAFGIDNFYTGWMKDLLGKETTEESVLQFIGLKDAHLKAEEDKKEWLIVLFWDNKIEDLETRVFKKPDEVDEFCNLTVDETGKCVFVIRGEMVMKYYPYNSKRKGNLLNKNQ